jgi:UDP-GlcNAc3NAcA epimerase
MADALQFAATKVSAHSDILDRLKLQPQGYLLATVHRAENTDDPDRLSNIMAALSELAETEPVILPLHPRTKKILEDHSPSPLTPNASLRLLEPVGYFDMIALEKSARMLLTDSGGMQKEAYWLKVPCITLRDETEWIETVENGWNILTGADREQIIETVRTFKAPSEHPPLSGDGQAAEKILDAICQESLNLW